MLNGRADDLDSALRILLHTAISLSTCKKQKRWVKRPTESAGRCCLAQCWGLLMRVRWAQEKEIDAVKQLADRNRGALGFVVRGSLEERIRRSELLVAEIESAVIGFVTFHNRRDGWTTIHELCISKGHRRRGVGRILVNAVYQHAVRSGQRGLRLKCPIDLPANGFYARVGFTRVGVEGGKRRALAVWQKWAPDARSGTTSSRPLGPDSYSFFITLTNHPKAVRDVVRLWDESGDKRDPFGRIVVTPLFSSRGTIAEVFRLKEDRNTVVMFDSGGYQVQMGKASYEELFDRLLRFYRENSWAHWYVLPDHVPSSSDSDREVEFKVRETIDFARLFIRMMPDDFVTKAVGVVHGRTDEQVRRCVEAYADMGLLYIGFGSFGTSGPNGNINLISQRTLKLLRLVQTLAEELGLRVHIFGIGSPSHLIRLAKANIIPTSFDSAGWWKAGAFGNVFFPGGRQLHVTAVRSFETTLPGLQCQRRRSGHKCPFCDDLKLLRRRRMNRILHNLAVMLDTIEQL
jgi:GNAT superfamily N-acetyltransferase